MNQNDERLISKFYKAQKNIKLKGDWVNEVTKDKLELGLLLEDEDIVGMPKQKFNGQPIF